MKLVISARDNTRGAFKKVGTQITGVTNNTKGLNKGLGAFRSTLGSLPGPAGRLVGALGPLGVAGAALAAGAAIGFFVSSAVKSFTAFEDSMANVRKTTGMTKEETTALGGAIDTMALRLPVAHEELAKIAAVAGQLGIQGSENILGFTETIAKMSTAFDMSAEDVATAMAKLANIYDIPLEQIGNMGSAINVLGNTTAASESQLMDFAMSLGPTGQQLGFTYEQTMALGASMIEMGVNSSDAGTRLNRAFSQIGQNINELSKFMGVSSDEFKKSFQDMPMETFVSVLDKLSEVEGSLQANTIATELFGEVGAKSIKSLIGNLDGISVNLKNVETGFKENISLEEEFAAKTDTLKAKFALVGNAAESLKINIGAAFAPLVGVLAGAATAAISGISNAFTAMQKIAGPVLDLLLIKFQVLKAFLEGLFAPIIDALNPLKGLLGDTGGAVNTLNTVLKVMADVFTIITGVANKLGTILGTLLAKAITPLVAKIKEGIATLTEFYNKLGPVKGLIEGFKEKVVAGAEAVGKWADSFEETVPAAKGLTEAVSELAEEAEKMAPVLSDSIKTLESSLTEASGSYKTAIGDISKEIETLKDAWNLASNDQKGAIEKQIKALVGVRDELKHGEEEADKYFDTHKKGTAEATKKQEEFTIKLGETTVTFKGMAAEVIKNADAYKDLQTNAETLLALDWNVFATLEAELPNIDAGIVSMSDAFVGLKGILNDNITELENVKQSVMDISEIAAPFLEAGFINGIKSIGSFAGALSDAGSAINTFSNLQEISVDGCVDFSLHVNDMVSALQILENQMDDLVPSFEAMGTLTTSIAKSFLGDESFIIETTKQLGFFGDTLEDIRAQGSMWDKDPWGHSSFQQIRELLEAMGATKAEAGEMLQSIGPDLQAEIVRLGKNSKDSADFIKKLSNSTLIMNVGLEISTSKLKAQTGQLSKITDALQPYLGFMRTLNELSVLSALSTDDLNQGLDAITDTLMNLSKALSTFDLEPTMQALFGSGTKGEGSAKAFTDTMLKHATDFSTLITYIERLSTAITTLTGAFDALGKINESVLADETALIALFGNITDIMENFSNAMDKSGFGEKLAAGIEKMVSSASPLTTYFKDNNAAVTQFNNTLSAFKSVLGSVVDTMDRLLEMTTMTVPEVEELAAGFDKAAKFVRTFDEALMMHVGAQEGQWDMEKYFNSVFNSIKNLASSWEMLTYDMGNSFETFGDAISTITGLISDITSLTNAFGNMKDIIIPEAIAMEAALSKIPAIIKAMTELLGKKTWSDISANIAAFALKWDTVSEGMSESMDSFSHFVGIINKIISACTEMTRIFTDMSAIVVIKSDEIAEALKDIPAVMAEVTKYLATDSFNALKEELINLDIEYKKHAKILDEVMPSYDSAFNMFAKLASNVITLSKAFEELKEATIISSIDMDKAMQNIDVFVNRFVEALTLNLDNLIGSLIDLDAEWAKHAEEMKVVMPSYEAATKDIGTLISSITSLGGALLSLSEMGVITSAKFDSGFSALISSVANFTKSLENNIVPLINSLRLLHNAWMENEAVLVPLMVDFVTITKNFATLAYHAIAMTKAFTELSENSGSLEKGFATLIKFIDQVVSSTNKFYTPENAAAIAKYVTDVGLVIYAFRYLAEQLETATSNIEKEVKEAVNTVSAKVLSLKDIIPDMYTHGANSIIAFARGIHDYEWVLGGVISGVADTIKKYLGVSSPTDLGALNDIENIPALSIEFDSTALITSLAMLDDAVTSLSDTFKNVPALSIEFDSTALITSLAMLDDAVTSLSDTFKNVPALSIEFDSTALITSLAMLDDAVTSLSDTFKNVPALSIEFDSTALITSLAMLDDAVTSLSDTFKNVPALSIEFDSTALITSLAMLDDAVTSLSDTFKNVPALSIEFDSTALITSLAMLDDAVTSLSDTFKNVPALSIEFDSTALITSLAMLDDAVTSLSDTFKNVPALSIEFDSTALITSLAMLDDAVTSLSDTFKNVPALSIEFDSTALITSLAMLDDAVTSLSDTFKNVPALSIEFDSTALITSLAMLDDAVTSLSDTFKNVPALSIEFDSTALITSLAMLDDAVTSLSDTFKNVPALSIEFDSTALITSLAMLDDAVTSLSDTFKNVPALSIEFDSTALITSLAMLDDAVTSLSDTFKNVPALSIEFDSTALITSLAMLDDAVTSLSDTFKNVPALSIEFDSTALITSLAMLDDAVTSLSDTFKNVPALSIEFDSTALITSLAMLDDAVTSLSDTFKNVPALSIEFDSTALITSLAMLDDAVTSLSDTFKNVPALSIEFDSTALITSLAMLDDAVTSLSDTFKNVPALSIEFDSTALITSLAMLDDAVTPLSDTFKNVPALSIEFDSTALITSLAMLDDAVTSLSDTFKNVPALSIEFDSTALITSLAMLDDAVTSLSDTFKNVPALSIEFDSTALITSLAMLDDAVTSLSDTFKNVPALSIEFDSTALITSLAMLDDAVTSLSDTFTLLEHEISNTLNNIENQINNSIQNIAYTFSKLQNMNKSMFVYGAEILFSFISGIRAWVPVLEAQLIAIANMIKAYLGVQSPTELGALKDIEEWPKNLVNSFASGIKSKMSTLNNSFSGMTLSAPGGGSGSNGGNTTYITFKVEQKITDIASAKVATTELEKMLNRHQML